MRDVAIIGVGMIPFGRRDEDTLFGNAGVCLLKSAG
jgi:acetyl-CoA acetyltransferase